MAWFHPKTLLDKTYEIGILLKGLDGTAELLGGLLLWLVPGGTILRVVTHLTHSELRQDPHDFLATHIMHLGQNLAAGHNTFAILFLLTHGLIKIVLVVALLRNLRWSYPFALVTLGLFVIYQVYQLVVRPTFGMVFLTVLDAVIIWLVWREWGAYKLRHTQSEPVKEPLRS